MRIAGRTVDGSVPAVVVALVLGGASAVALAFLTYDSWAWMVWARELARMTLSEAGGPVMKPLPVLIAAPFARFGAAAPFIWLTVVRASFLLTGWLAWRIASRLGGSLAGFLAAGFLLLVPGYLATALQGYSEPVFVLLVLVAISGLMAGRAPVALLALAFAGLLRSEEWPFLLVFAIWAARSGRVSVRTAVICVLAPPLVWLGLDWFGSGDPLRSLSHAAAGRGRTAGQQLDALIDDLGAMNLIGASVAGALAWRLRKREVVLILLAAVAWTALILAKGVFGYPVGGRYLIPAAALLALCAGWGFAGLLERMVPVGVLAAVIAAVFVLVPAASSLRQARDSVTAAYRQVDAGKALPAAIDAAGGRASVAGQPGPAVMVNTPMLTELAWRLDVPLAGVATVWADHPNDQLRAPAMVFVAPGSRIGKPLGLPSRFSAKEVAFRPPWRVLLMTSRGG